jgi:predicted nucleic acid-binding protein
MVLLDTDARSQIIKKDPLSEPDLRIASIPLQGKGLVESYGKIRSFLESKGKTIGPLDTLIATHALSLDLTLVSNNIKEFSRIPNLKCENWVSEP